MSTLVHNKYYEPLYSLLIMPTPSQRTQKYQDNLYACGRCVTCGEKNPRYPKHKCQSCADKQSHYYHTIGKLNRLRPSVRLMRYMVKRIKQLENELRRLKNVQ